MKLIVLSPFPYHSKVAHGGGILSFQQLKLLASRHEVHFLSFHNQETSDELSRINEELGKICKTISTIQLNVTRKSVFLSKLSLLFKLAPIEASLHASEEMHRKLSQTIAAVRPDVVFIQFPLMAQYVSSCKNEATIIDVQDAFSVSEYRRFRSQQGFFKRTISFMRWISWVFHEARFYQKFDVVAAITEQDRVGLEIFSPGLGAVVSPAAVEIPAMQTDLAGTSNTISFIGSFAHKPNIEAVRHFIENIFPLVLARVPDALFLVAGKNVPTELTSLASDNIKFLGFVPDAAKFMQSSAVIAIPLLSGGGIKIKTLEALAAGCAVVSTPIGAEEIGASNEKHLLIADDPHQFAQHIVNLILDPSLRKKLGQNARELISSQFSWQAKSDSLDRLLQSAVSKHAEKLIKPGIDL
ncbi:MAG: glycosyltransferase [Burkholderiales bacterium]|nr:glycosyltransferase [Burkholderiales bacterium]